MDIVIQSPRREDCILHKVEAVHVHTTDQKRMFRDYSRMDNVEKSKASANTLIVSLDMGK